MVAEGLSLRMIAKRARRSPNTISRELRKNKIGGEYRSHKADRKAYQRRKDAKYQGMKVLKHGDLQNYVDAHLLDDLSPEAIAGRIAKHEKRLPSVSKNSIRRYIDSAYGAKVAYHRRKKRNQRKWRKKRPGVAQLEGRRFIDTRPSYIQKRRYVGDAEADFIVSGKQGKGIILTLADRQLRVSFLEQITEVTIEEVHAAFLRIKRRFPELKTVSTDNDLLFARHQELEDLLGIKIYFCHPYHSWEKGTIENANKYVRKDIPKGSDISKYSKQFIAELETKLNRRFMEIRNYRTPQEMLDLHRNRKKR